jgi:hypothetical protein
MTLGRTNEPAERSLSMGVRHWHTAAKAGIFPLHRQGRGHKKEFTWLKMLEYGTMPKKRSENFL